MKKFANQAALFAYLGTALMFLGFDPNIAPWPQNSVFMHALSHLLLFAGAAMFFYGLETLRKLAQRHRRMTS